MSGPSQVSLEMITSSGVVGINVVMELCQQVWMGGDFRGLEDECGDTNH